MNSTLGTAAVRGADNAAAAREAGLPAERIIHTLTAEDTAAAIRGFAGEAGALVNLTGGEPEGYAIAEPGAHYRDFFAQMYGNAPVAWDEALEGVERLRVIVNAFTRLRYCSAAGEMEFHHKGAPGTQPPGWLPWFEVPGRKSVNATIVTGHWSALGLINRNDLIALDTGCLWGGSLTAIRLEDRQVFAVPCPQLRRPKS